MTEPVSSREPPELSQEGRKPSKAREALQAWFDAADALLRGVSEGGKEDA